MVLLLMERFAQCSACLCIYLSWQITRARKPLGFTMAMILNQVVFKAFCQIKLVFLIKSKQLEYNIMWCFQSRLFPFAS